MDRILYEKYGILAQNNVMPMEYELGWQGTDMTGGALLLQAEQTSEAWGYLAGMMTARLNESLAREKAVNNGLLDKPPDPGVRQVQQGSGDGNEGAGKAKFDSLDDFINNPKKLGEATPEQLYKHLQDNGFNPLSLSGGNTKGIPFEQGGGFKVNWGGDRILQYHPAGLNHHGGGAYFKMSSGPTGTLRFDLNGNLLP